MITYAGKQHSSIWGSSDYVRSSRLYIFSLLLQKFNVLAAIEAYSSGFREKNPEELLDFQQKDGWNDGWRWKTNHWFSAIPRQRHCVYAWHKPWHDPRTRCYQSTRRVTSYDGHFGWVAVPRACRARPTTSDRCHSSSDHVSSQFTSSAQWAELTRADF